MGLAAACGGVIGLVYFPLHTLAYFATEDGRDSQGAVKWADFGRDLLEPLLDWGSADTVYRTYGKVYVVVILGLVLGLLALWSRRQGGENGLERWGFRTALVGYPLALLGAIVEYWTPYLALSIPLGLILTAANGHLSAGLLPLDLGWIALGWWLWSESAGKSSGDPVGDRRNGARRR